MKEKLDIWAQRILPFVVIIGAIIMIGGISIEFYKDFICECCK